MKILYIVPYAPNLIRVRPYNLIRSLAGWGHAVTVATLGSGASDEKDADHLRSLGVRVDMFPMPRWRSAMNCALALPTATPLQTVYSWQPALARYLEALCLPQGAPAFDAVHVEHLRGARYGLHLLGFFRRRQATVPVIWDSVDCISYLFRQAVERSQSFFGKWLTRFELTRTPRAEAALLRRFPQVVVTSRIDRQELLNLPSPESVQPRVEIIPNGVDLGYFTPDPALPRQPDTLVVSGKMSYHANVTMVLHLAREILPLIWQQNDKVRLWVVGKDPAPALQALAEDPRITVTGMVDDLRPYLRQAAVAVAPLPYGAGAQNKVLEAMACAAPVVCTPNAVAALDVQPDREVILARQPAEFAQAVLSLLAQPARCEAVGMAGRRYVEVQHHWPTIANRLVDVYQKTPVLV
jgi:sugar transferase (PEP-CTERM/EpsH1 system associated)